MPDEFYAAAVAHCSGLNTSSAEGQAALQGGATQLNALVNCAAAGGPCV